MLAQWITATVAKIVQGWGNGHHRKQTGVDEKHYTGVADILNDVNGMALQMFLTYYYKEKY